MRVVEPQQPVENGSGIISLTRGMIGDAHELAQQEFALMKSEFRQELDKIKMTGFSMAIAIVICFVGLIPLPFLVAELLVYLTPEGFPIWGAQLATSILFLALGVAIFFYAKNRRSW